MATPKTPSVVSHWWDMVRDRLAPRWEMSSGM